MTKLERTLISNNIAHLHYVSGLLKIRGIYNKCPEGYHVDHEIPLQGKLVCGLHVEDNLQYLTATENMKKGNKYTPVT